MLRKKGAMPPSQRNGVLRWISAIGGEAIIMMLVICFTAASGFLHLKWEVAAQGSVIESIRDQLASEDADEDRHRRMVLEKLSAIDIRLTAKETLLNSNHEQTRREIDGLKEVIREIHNLLISQSRRGEYQGAAGR